MKFSYSFDDLVQLLSPLKIVGHTDVTIFKINSLLKAGAGEISFLGNAKYRAEVEKSRASVILVPENFPGFPVENQAFLFFKNPSFALAMLCRDIERQCLPKPAVGIHHSAIVSDKVTLGSNVSIGPFVVIESETVIADGAVIMAGCYVGHNVKIGQQTVLHPSVKVMPFCEIGNRVTLFPGVVIGSDGFGYETVNGTHEKIPQIGNVVIEDDIDIGANSTIDRARFGSTIVGRGTKIDNLVQVGHNVVIGNGCLIVAQTGISGSAIIGNYVIIGGQAGLGGHITIPDKVSIAGQSSVPSCKYKPGTVLRGSPAMPINEANRFYVLRKHVPDLFKRVSKIEKLLGENSRNSLSV